MLLMTDNFKCWARPLYSFQKRYQRFVDALVGEEYESPMKDVVSSTLLGGPDFISYIKGTFLSDKKPHKDLPALKELAPKASMQNVFDVVDESFSNNAKLARNVKMYLCQKYTGEKLKDIGSHFGISESGVSQAGRRVLKWMEKDKKLRREIGKLEKKIRPSRMKTWPLFCF